jgi:hypothetical protein
MFSKSARRFWVRGAITLVSAANLLAAPPAHAEVKSWPASFRAEQMSMAVILVTSFIRK